ncbi:hypothetical protein [Phocaeicola faecicola]|uniref:NigD1/NigD2 family lipoprotein n=1 Tax=Phocaeicola faecicola TaxID=2739389 RepID=UPI0015E7D6E1|nr:NigD-like C-terminal domain-containing protein [Phocaeicola faecicola]MCI5742246.1 NigD-like protein [Bacteroides sp.]MDD6907679.1 NigD-like C-terminal domain-containing protein [Bacteroidaceae bacterium]MDY4870903.1 NigD-like C-terminal domain-containing protein [Phocaeicola faecicola]
MMKHWLRYCLAGLMGIFVMSCSEDEGYSIGDIGIDLATVHVEGDGVYTFSGDTWGTMYPAVPLFVGYNLVEGQRAFLRFNPLYDNYGGYDVGIKVEAIRPVLTKSVEQVNEENEEEFGNHPAYLDELWISGGYLNVQFYQKLPVKAKHRVSLVYRGEAPQLDEDGYICLEYRYNTYGDTLSNSVAKEMVCYNLNTLPMNDAKGIKLQVDDAKCGKTTLVFEKKNDSQEAGTKLIGAFENKIW